jgi:hypothetical protein
MGADDADVVSERAELHFLAALVDELMRKLLIAGVMTQGQLNEIEAAVSQRTGAVARAW